MQCPYCKEEIKEGAKKCQVCGEFLGLRGKLKNFTGPFGGMLSILIPVGALGLACLEFHARNVAVAEKKVAVANEEIAVEVRDEAVTMIAEEIDRRVALKGIKTYLSPEKYAQIMRKSYIGAEQEFIAKIEEDPKNEEAKRGLIYLEVLKKIR